MCCRVLETLPLYDILNEFQKGHSHMAVVVRQCKKPEEQHVSSASDSKCQFLWDFAAICCPKLC
jgi:hypothetical protein